MAFCMRCSKRMKICCGVTAAIVILLVVILVILIFTVFKQKDPTITLQSVKVKEASLIWPTFSINVSLGVLLTVENPNFGSFSYHNSTAYLKYRGRLFATAPLHEDTLPARGSLNISTSLDVYVDDITKFLDLMGDYLKGVINFTSTTTLEGRVKVLKLFKTKATKRILSEHPSCFPKLGQIQIHAMKVKRKGYFYHLSDSMFVKSAFYGFNKSWFLSVDASPLGDRGQNECSSGSPNQQVLLGNSDNGLINDEKEKHDFVNPSLKAAKDDNIDCEEEISKSVPSATEKQKSKRKEDDAAEYVTSKENDASMLRPGDDNVQREIAVIADTSVNATKEVIVESEFLKDHQHSELNDNNATIDIGTESMKEASGPARATNKQTKSKRSLIHDADVGKKKKGKKRSSNSHEIHLTSFGKDAEADPSSIRGGAQEENNEDDIISKDISMSKPTLEKMEIGTDVNESKEPKHPNEDNLNIVTDQCLESEVGLTDRAEGIKEVLQDDPKPMQLEESTLSEENKKTKGNIKESNVTSKAVDINGMDEPVKSESKKRRKRKYMEVDERTTRKEECMLSNQNNTDANVSELNVPPKVVLGISVPGKSEKKRKTRKEKNSDGGKTVGESIGPTDSSDSKIVMVESLKSTDCNPASGDIGADENPLNQIEGENIQQEEMKGAAVSAAEKDDASRADNLGSLEHIETIANAEHVDKKRKKKSKKKQSSKSKSLSNMLTEDVNGSQKPLPSSDSGTLASPTSKITMSASPVFTNKPSKTELEPLKYPVGLEPSDSQLVSGSNESQFPSNTAKGIDNLAPVEANDAAKDSACLSEEKDDENLEASLKDNWVNVEQQSPSQQKQRKSHLGKMVSNVQKTERDAKLSSQSNSDMSSTREKGKPRDNASGKSMNSANHLPISTPTMKGSRKVIHPKGGKAKLNNVGEVKGKTQHKKSLLSGTIFKDDSSGTSEDTNKVVKSDASTRSPSENSLLSDFSDGDISEGSHGGKRLENGEQSDFKASMSSVKGKPIDHVLRSSSRYKKAKITASQLQESESQPEFVPDSLAE
ncbi:hypothetical protein PIB30_028814 [Stylosanthes scabra]|uniref:Late embryogenesis abundant protein LEA-2 subgroup domain-containing protein n=1 Tax=Stylosanthes scabra TaxID=79078 RepID=A0ABU6TCY0_9FABA|nr:hypothetical protein [Stylosanthes scabra]